MECADEAGTSSTEPTDTVPDHPLNGDSVDLPYRVSIEHCYSRLVPFRSSPPPCSLSLNASFPTTVLFENCITDKSKLEAINRKWGGRFRKDGKRSGCTMSTSTNGISENVRYV